MFVEELTSEVLSGAGAHDSYVYSELPLHCMK